MTTFNGGLFLREQLESIYNQSQQPDEVVVCDDGSTDNTIEILEEYRQLKGLKYYINKPGLGVNRNFFKVISLCTCDYVALSDQDDVWLPNKIEITYNKLCELDGEYPVVVSSQAYDVDKDLVMLNINQQQFNKDTHEFFDTFLNNKSSQGCSLMFNKNAKDIVLRNYNKFVDNIYFDAYIAYTAALLGVKYNIGQRLMLYRHHQNNVIGKDLSKSSLSFTQHLRVQGRFRHFIMQQQIEQSMMVYNLYRPQIKEKQIHTFFSNLAYIEKSKSKMKSYRVICLMPELPIKRKIKIIISTTIIDILRFIMRINS